MRHECLKPEELDQEALSETVRRQAAECPRCHELLASFDQFMRAEELPGSRPDEAEQQLGTFLQGLPPRLVRTRRSRRILGMRPVGWGVAAAAAVALVFLWPRQAEIPELPTLRDEVSASFGLLSPEAGQSGWLLRWTGVEEADAYEVRLYSTSLEELRRIGPLDTTFTTLEYPAEDGVTWLWRAVALRGGDVIDETDVGTLTR